MSSIYYPPADRTTRWYQDKHPTSAFRSGVEKVVLHCTEGGDWPTYSGGAVAPHLTVKSDGKKLIWHQHFRLDRYSRALRNAPGGVETNTDGAIQVEIVGTCDRNSHVKGLHTWNLPDYAIDGLAEFIEWCHKWLGVPLIAPRLWPSYPSSPELDKRARMSGAEWNAFRGICGHLHVPENTHLDPGDLPIQKILGRVAMALSTEDKEWILKNVPKAVWKYDGITAPKSEDDPKNPTWRPDSYLRVIADQTEGVRGLRRDLVEVLRELDELKAGLTAGGVAEAFAAGLTSITEKLEQVRWRLEV